ncbi:PREDICTED: photosynthetic NDH subunit of lumenal location 3, chloroplastic-like [Camelina sativa]|uniref:Photosynthetic NDH subunit of lumenal location 3, chloroplastic-like n=1 Tax=Camelina sativa TaxID=90675 RepID=A0ABM0VZA9_CAMSA|nr:PREDICTED: photosynthetic NDH subunit of lumenal location 3, chloroplastic-like [Camelina sativa]
MAHFLNLNSLTNTLSSIPKLPESRKISKPAGFACRRTVECQELDSVQITRRMTLGSAVSIGLTGIFGQNNVSLAQDNGFWIDGPLPIPPIYNNIVNEQTGTRTFIKKGVYVADIGTKGRMYRVKKNAFDLLAMEDLIGPDTLNYVKKYLRLKSTFLFYDFDNLISAAASEDKQSLTDLANRLFDNFEKLEDAAKAKNLSKTESCYTDTKILLQEVMTRMA